MSEKIVSYSNLVTYNKELKKALGTSTSSDINYCYNQVAYYSQDNSTTNKVSTAASTTNIMGNLGIRCMKNGGMHYMGYYDAVANSIEYTVEREERIINWKGHIQVDQTIDWIKIELPSQTINNTKYSCDAIYASITPNVEGTTKNVVTSIPYAHIVNYDDTNLSRPGRGVYIRNFSYQEGNIETNSQYISFDIRAVIKSTNVQ